jgi:hypothetical protein
MNTDAHGWPAALKAKGLATGEPSVLICVHLWLFRIPLFAKGRSLEMISAAQAPALE